MIPGRQPELSGGVYTWLPLAMNRFADVHSATSPRSLSRITSSKPRACADSSQVRFIAQERILVPVNWQAAWRASRTYASLTPSPQCLESAVSPIRSLARPLDGPAHMPPPLRTIAMRSVQLGAWLASTSSSILRRTASGILRQRPRAAPRHRAACAPSGGPTRKERRRRRAAY